MPKWLLRALPNMDIEGEKLREFRDAVEWTATQNGAALSSEQLVAGVVRAGTVTNAIGPIELDVQPGAILLGSGDLTSRRILAATIAGRLDPISGLLQVAGHPLPSESSKVAQLVAMADVGGLEREETEVTLGQLLTERLRLTQGQHRGASRRQRVHRLVDRINTVLVELAPGAVQVTVNSTMQQLPQRERAIALAAVALAEQSPVVILDLLDSFAQPDEESVFIGAVCRLAPESTTLLVFTPNEVGFESLRQCGDRVVSLLDLTVLERPSNVNSPSDSAVSNDSAIPNDSAQGVLK